MTSTMEGSAAPPIGAHAGCAAKRRMIASVAGQVVAHADELTELDSAIGDGDHGHNMKRGFEAVVAGPGRARGHGLPDLLRRSA